MNGLRLHSTEDRSEAGAAPARRSRVPLVAFAGLAFVSLPTFLDLAAGAWRDEAYAHGPLIVAVSAALVWRARAELAAIGRPAPRAGLAFVVLGLMLWLLGRTQALVPIEAAALLPLAAGCVLLAWGLPGLRRLAFPLAFLAFYVPMPGFVLDLFTAPLKEAVSSIVAHVLAFAGYAVERNGVVLLVQGQELLVADACSGLNSLVSLTALGLLYGHLRGASAWRMAILVLAVLPIALVANALRVLALALIATHVGPEATQGWIHDLLGLSVFVVALLLLVALDRLLPQTGARYGTGTWDRSGTGTHLSQVPVPYLAPVVALVLMASAAVAAPALKPVASAEAIDLEAAVPAQFAGWRIDPEDIPIAPSPDVAANLARLYTQVVSRTYVNAQGERIMLTVAHGGDQSDALKAHRQESCYRAQGFRVRGIERTRLQAGNREIPVTRFLATRADRVEPVTYWFTMGDRVVLGRWERLGVQLKHGLRGRIPDGMLVRVSSIDPDKTHAYAAQGAFTAALLDATPRNEAIRLAGQTTR